ncbi:uncharacterized protein CBL_03337 [Carabus blaptoides fortunei]
MSTYPGLATSAVRESVSLDEDELSDVEDEVFIRDGRNGYKLAEDRGVKRPLMAPRRKIGKPDITSRLKNRPPCRVFWVPCCYAFAALTVFLGLIVLVIILVSLFPLPLDRFKSWIISKTGNAKPSVKIYPCTDLEVTDVWSFNLPKLASESALRNLDVNGDGFDDIVFGFGLGEEVQLPQQWFCPLFMGVKPPCQGGVIALDGLTVFCTADLTGDNVFDCLASGKGGVLSAINGHDGTIIWEFVNNKTLLVMDVYSGSFIPDQDGDDIVDVIASHTLQTGGVRKGFLLIISGKTGSELARVSTPNSTETLFAPQLFVRLDGQNTILFGTGSQSTPGALYMIPLHDISMKIMKPILLYEDQCKGVLLPVVLVDINGDAHEDIVSAMFNTTIIAFDGKTLNQLWNFTVNNSETLSTPTPGYFTSDNVTDFLIKYQTGPGFPLYYYSQTIIIDGKTGKPIYNRPIIDSVGTQMGGLTISMEDHGQDMFIYWMADSSNIWQKSRADLCKLRFNSSMVTKLYSLNQYNEPPGVLLYTSENRTLLEYNGTKTPLDEVRLYLQENPDFDISFRNANSAPNVDVNANINPLNNIEFRKTKFNNGGSNFRHRDDGQGLVKEFTREETRNHINSNNNNKNNRAQTGDKYDYDQPDTPWVQSPVDDMLDPSQLDYPETYTDDSDRSNILNTNMESILPSNIATSTNRDPRSKADTDNNTPQLTDKGEGVTRDYEKRKTKKKNLADTHNEAYGPNDYNNIYMARNRLLHDLNDLPTEILRETYQKNRERQLRNNKFEQRDLRYRENEGDETVNKTEAETKNMHFPESLWDLESEKELEDRENGYWRGKRDAEYSPVGIPRITSTGVLLQSLPEPKSQNSIDIVFATYWVLPKQGAYVILEKDAQCIRQKMLASASPTDKYFNLERSTKADLFTKMCLEERGVLLKPNPFPEPKNDALAKSLYYKQISQLTLGQMTVYRLRLQCKCQILKSGERCSRILKQNDQVWSSYMGQFGDGVFKAH